MSQTHILTLLHSEISKLQEARILIAGYRMQKPESPESVPSVADPKAKIRNLSPEARARIVAGVKARWAKQKESAK